jgi:hypothetical protein
MSKKAADIIDGQKRQRMIMRLFTREKFQPVLGHDIDKPRITAAGWLLICLYLGVPAMLMGGAIDFVVQWITGDCLGVWCMFQKK